MGFTLDVSVPAITVFLQGLLSFFSPCVLPLLPLYIGYLSGGTGVRQEDGRVHYHRGKVLLHTLFFVVGVSFAFFLLGLGVSAIGTFFNNWQVWFARIGGVLVILFGCYQLGLFGMSDVLGSEHRLTVELDQFAMSPLTALLMGFTFSFAWTPCVGPVLTSVLLMAASTGTRMTGFLLIGVYTLGFVLPFLAVGLFTTSLLELLKKHRGVVQYTVKIGGILMILMGLMMVSGRMNAIAGYLSGGTVTVQEETAGEPEKEAESISESDEAPEPGSESPEDRQNAPEQSSEAADPADSAFPPAIAFELEDQFGNIHTLEDYRGKTIFLNFWATWCPPCRAEMPDIQKLYETRDTEGDDALIVLGVAGPNVGQEGTKEEIAAFLEEQGYTYPVLMDETGSLFYAYGVSSLPTTYMIDRDGKIFGYVSGSLSMDMMEDIIEQTMTGNRR